MVNEQHRNLNSLTRCKFSKEKFEVIYLKIFPKTKSFLKFLSNYEYLFLTTLLGVDGYNYANFLEEGSSKKNIFYINHDLATIDSAVPTLEKKLLDENRTFVLRDNIKYQNLPIPFVAPVYFGETNNIDAPPHRTKPNKKTKFLSVGGVWRNGIRNFATCFEVAKRLVSAGEEFEIVFVGVDKELLQNYITPEIEKNITLVGKIPYELLYQQIENIDYLLFGIDKNVTDYKKYLFKGITGTFGLSIGFTKPSLIYKELGDAYGLDATLAINYEDNNFYDAMKQAIKMQACDYNMMRDNLFKFQQELMLKSKQNIKKQ
ncbi:MAG: hypothetical protein LBD41_02340, partial [Clostridiales Family XIII bacterium]|nr:hypothetical protein [Clostridiales Family XIII bacterium]